MIEGIYVGGSKNGDTPIAGWFIMEHTTKIRMMTGGTPINRNPHMLRRYPFSPYKRALFLRPVTV